jgi:hypothetical protein
MKTVQESKTKQRIAIVLAIVAILVVARTFMTMGGPNSAPAPAAAPAAPVSSSSPIKGKLQLSDTMDPRLQLDLLANSEEVKYEGKGKNIFTAAPEVAAVIPKVVVSPLKTTPPPPAVYVPPPPPPINLKFFGITNTKGEKPKVFLSQGEDIWIAREGDVVNRHYKIVRISPNTVEVEDLLNNNRQSIPLTQG